MIFDIGLLIGEGGQADVHLARLRETGGLYAVKLLRECWDPIARQNFEREGMRQARVAGPHVVAVVAVNFACDRPFIVLEYMPRGSLAKEMQGGPIPPTQAIAVVREVAIALNQLHADGVVHRDVKPGNVLRASDGRLVLNDLGCAATTSFTDFVQTEGFVGTPAYAAPEQRAGFASPCVPT